MATELIAFGKVAPEEVAPEEVVYDEKNEFK